MDPILYPLEQPMPGSMAEFLDKRYRLIAVWHELTTGLDTGLIPEDNRQQAETMLGVVGDILIGACDSEGLTVF